MLDNDLKIDSSQEGKITITVRDEFEDEKLLTGSMFCEDGDKTILIEQFNKLLDDPKMVGLDFLDCMPVFERGCRFKSKIFDLDENVYKNTAEWMKTLNVPTDVDVLIWADGEPSMLQFSDIVSGMCEAAGLEGDVMISFNGKPLDEDQIRLSIWF